MASTSAAIYQQAMELYKARMTRVLTQIAEQTPEFFQSGISVLLKPDTTPEERKAFLETLQAAPSPEAWMQAVQTRLAQVGMAQAVKEMMK